MIERRSFTHGWYALASWTCGSNGYFNGGSRAMALNSRTMDPLATWQDRFVIIHEFGHLMGLAHVPGGCNVAIMRSDAMTGTASCSSADPPFYDDVNGMNARY